MGKRDKRHQRTAFTFSVKVASRNEVSDSSLTRGESSSAQTNAGLESILIGMGEAELAVNSQDEVRKNKFMGLDDLKKKIRELDPRDFVEECIIPGLGDVVTEEQIIKVQQIISDSTGIKIERNEILVVGSAKIGYGLFEKKRKDDAPLPPFREFDGNSDIDIAFASKQLFDVIWNELAAYANGQARMPYRMNSLGDYLVYGWIRPDHVPKGARLRTYDQWNDAVRRLTASPIFKRRKVSGALYRDIEFLTKYQARGIARCKADLELL